MEEYRDRSCLVLIIFPSHTHSSVRRSSPRSRSLQPNLNHEKYLSYSTTTKILFSDMWVRDTGYLLDIHALDDLTYTMKNIALLCTKSDLGKGKSLS